MIEIIVCILAGLAAGTATGFAGLSAATIVTPALVTILGFDPFVAIGIALASDVLASLFSALTYAKNKNIDIKNGLIMMITALVLTIIGTFVSHNASPSGLGIATIIMPILLGIKFIIKPIMEPSIKQQTKTRKQKIIASLIGGTIIGFICGFIGAGGGMMMLILLVFWIGYDLKTAVGTSVFIMTFTALTGAISHFVVGGAFNISALIWCVFATLIGAVVASTFANKVKPKTLNRVTGVVLVIFGFILFIVKLF